MKFRRNHFCFFLLLVFICSYSFYSSYVVLNKRKKLQYFPKRVERLFLHRLTNNFFSRADCIDKKNILCKQFALTEKQESHYDDDKKEEENETNENKTKKNEPEENNNLKKQTQMKNKTFKVIRNLPLIAIIGRPNVGKSTIFNRLTRKFQEGNIVLDICSTRDRVYGEADWDGQKFELVDTGGLIIDEKEEHKFSKEIKDQILLALCEASLVLFVVDGLKGVQQEDLEICKFLRNYIQKKKKVKTDEGETKKYKESNEYTMKIIVCVNKCESYKDGYLKAQEFWQLGFGTPFPCSGIHGNGLSEILDEVLKYIEKINVDEIKKEKEKENTINVSFIGKPNTGKSSILNKILKNNRFIVSPIAGTTVDSVDVLVRVNKENEILNEEINEENDVRIKNVNDKIGKEKKEKKPEEDYSKKTEESDIKSKGRIYRLIDTAGIQKLKKNVPFNNQTKFKYLLFNRTEKAIRRSDVCILVIDSFSGISSHDINIARKIVKENKSCIICCNKWDLIHNKNDIYDETKNYVLNLLKPIDYADIIFVSAKTSQRLVNIFRYVEETYKNFTKKINTNALNQVIKEALLVRPPIPIKNKSLKIYYAFQAHIKPPGFVFFCNSEKSVYTNYTKYLESRIRENFQIKSTPIKIYYKQKKMRHIAKQLKQPEKYNLDIEAIQKKFLKMQNNNNSSD